jgi:membrane-bound lytic murein transglycosylase A
MSRATWILGVLVFACSGPQRAPDDGAALPVPVDAAVEEPREPEPPPDQLRLTRASFDQLPGWADDKHGESLVALRRSCRALSRKPADKPLGLYAIAGKPGDWKEACRAAAAVKTDAEARAFYERHFVPFEVSNNDDAVGRFTGYYLARITGSRKKSARFKYPVWGRPKDLISARISDFIPSLRGERIWGKVSGDRLVPYETRAEIYRGAIKDRAKVLFWADDPTDIFFAQVQGSALAIVDGVEVRIGVGGKNGRRYTAIGRVLIERGALTRETVSMQTIRAWIASNLARAMELLERNDAFIFFRERDGPRGAQGVVLTPGRSLAVDLRWMPMSLPLWVDTTVPVPMKEGEEVWRRVMIAQDTGGAIRSPVRGDIYFGHSDEAADQAGRMKGRGGYWVLIPKETAERGDFPEGVLDM